MAIRENKYSDNVDGKYFVDDQCIACDACVTEAPDFFRMNHQAGHAFVSKQPITPQDHELCNQAIDVCPVEAIGR